MDDEMNSKWELDIFGEGPEPILQGTPDLYTLPGSIVQEWDMAPTRMEDADPNFCLPLFEVPVEDFEEHADKLLNFTLSNRERIHNSGAGSICLAYFASDLCSSFTLTLKPETMLKIARLNLPVEFNFYLQFSGRTRHGGKHYMSAEVNSAAEIERLPGVPIGIRRISEEQGFSFLNFMPCGSSEALMSDSVVARLWMLSMQHPNLTLRVAKYLGGDDLMSSLGLSPDFLKQLAERGYSLQIYINTAERGDKEAFAI